MILVSNNPVEVVNFERFLLDDLLTNFLPLVDAC